MPYSPLPLLTAGPLVVLCYLSCLPWTVSNTNGIGQRFKTRREEGKTKELNKVESKEMISGINVNSYAKNVM